MNLLDEHNLAALLANVENAIGIFYDQKKIIVKGETINSSTVWKYLNIITGNSSIEGWSILHYPKEDIPFYHYNFYNILFISIAAIFILPAIFSVIVNKLWRQNEIVKDYEDSVTEESLLAKYNIITYYNDQPFVPTENDTTEGKNNRMENEDQQLVQTENDTNEEQTHSIDNDHLPLDLPTNDIRDEQRNRNDDEVLQLPRPPKDVSGEQINRNDDKDQQVFPQVDDVNRGQSISRCKECHQLLPPANNLNEKHSNPVENSDKSLILPGNGTNEEQEHPIEKGHPLLVPVVDDGNRDQTNQIDSIHQPLRPKANNVNGDGNNPTDNKNQKIVYLTNIDVGERNNRGDNENEDPLLPPSKKVNKQEENDNPKMNDSPISDTVTDENISSDIKNDDNNDKNNENSSDDSETKPLPGNKSSSSNETKNNINRENEDNKNDVKPGSLISGNETSMNISDDNKAINTIDTEKAEEAMAAIQKDTKDGVQSGDQKELDAKEGHDITPEQRNSNDAEDKQLLPPANIVNEEGNNCTDKKNQKIVPPTNIIMKDGDNRGDNESDTMMNPSLSPSKKVNKQEENDNPEMNNSPILDTVTDEIISSDIKKTENKINRENEGNEIDVKAGDSPISGNETSVNTSDHNKAINAIEVPAESKNGNGNAEHKTIDTEKAEEAMAATEKDTKNGVQSGDQKEIDAKEEHDITPEKRNSNDDKDQQLLPPANIVNEEGNNCPDKKNKKIVLPTIFIMEDGDNRGDNESDTMNPLLPPSKKVDEQDEDDGDNPEMHDFSSSGTVTDETISSDIKNDKIINKNDENSSDDSETKPLRGNKSSSSDDAKNYINGENEDNKIDGSGEPCDSKAGDAPILENETSMNTSDDNEAITTEKPAETKNENVNGENKSIDIEKLFDKIKAVEKMAATQKDNKDGLQSEDQQESGTFNVPNMDTNVQVNSSDKSTDSKNVNEGLLCKSNINDSPKSQNNPEKKTPENNTDETKVEGDNIEPAVEALESEKSPDLQYKEDEMVNENIENETENIREEQDLGEAEAKDLGRQDSSEPATDSNYDNTHDSSESEDEKGDKNGDKKDDICKKHPPWYKQIRKNKKK